MTPNQTGRRAAAAGKAPEKARDLAGARARAKAIGPLLEGCAAIDRQVRAAVRTLTRGSGITGPQWGILGVFAGPEGPFSVAEAARRIGQTRQSVQGIADLLADKALIEFRPDPNHRRTKLVTVTDSGRALLRKLRARQTRWTRQVASHLDGNDVETALQFTRHIRAHLADQSQ